MALKLEPRGPAFVGYCTAGSMKGVYVAGANPCEVIDESDSSWLQSWVWDCQPGVMAGVDEAIFLGEELEFTESPERMCRIVESWVPQWESMDFESAVAPLLFPVAGVNPDQVWPVLDLAVVRQQPVKLRTMRSLASLDNTLRRFDEKLKYADESLRLLDSLGYVLSIAPRRGSLELASAERSSALVRLAYDTPRRWFRRTGFVDWAMAQMNNDQCLALYSSESYVVSTLEPADPWAEFASWSIRGIK